MAAATFMAAVLAAGLLVTGSAQEELPLLQQEGTLATPNGGSSFDSFIISRPSCSYKPISSSRLQPGLTFCKVLIVGGGPGGLFSAWMLRHLGRDLCVVEKRDIWGGKMQGTNPPTPTPGADPQADPKALGTCGLRINEAFKDERCLAYQLGIKTEESGYDTLLHTRNTWSRSTQQFLGSAAAGGGSNPNLFPGLTPADPNNEDLETAMLEYAFVATGGTNPVTGKAPNPHPSTNCARYSTIAQYLFDLYGKPGYDFLMVGNSFRGDWTAGPFDLCDYIEYYRVDWERPSNNFYPLGGFRGLHKAIRERVEAAGVRLFPSSNITCLNEVVASVSGSHYYRRPRSTTAKYVAMADSGAGWMAERLIINVGPVDFASIQGSLGRKLSASPVLTSIIPMKVAVYNAFWPTRWWEKYVTKKGRNFRLITPSEPDNCLVRSEFPGTEAPASVNASRPIYTDDVVCVAKWQQLYAKGGVPAVRRGVLTALRKLFPKEQIPDPVFDAFYLSANAWHYLKAGAASKNITGTVVADWALNPLGSLPAGHGQQGRGDSSAPSNNLCLVGEAYYLVGSGWSWGAMQSALRCVERNHADLISSATQQQKAEIALFKSGCAGVPVDSNGLLPTEVPAPPLVEPLPPGLNPATGKPFTNN